MVQNRKKKSIAVIKKRYQKQEETMQRNRENNGS